MRRTNKKRATNRYYNILLITLILMIIFTIFFSINVLSQGEQIEILITDTSDFSINQITEGETFKVSVFDSNLETNVFLKDVKIEFNEETYHIKNSSETREIEIISPDVEEDKEFLINATKNNLFAQETITVKDQPTLIIIPENYVVDEEQKFSVTIKNKDTNEPVEGVDVYIQSFIESKDTTDENGIAFLKAPKNREEITIKTDHKDYETASLRLELNAEPSAIEKFFDTGYASIIIAVILLIVVILFVNYRQRKSVFKRAKEITKKKRMKKYDLDTNGNNSSKDESRSMDQIRVNSKPDSKVEEIRISRSRKEKEVVPIKAEEDKKEKIIKNKKEKRKDYDWFEGTDDVRYEINRLTGKIDEEGVDKWFEGIDKLKKKIDEKVKEDKKKKEEKE